MRKIRSLDAFTHQGFSKAGTPNKGSEDTFAVRDNSFFAVIDGATSMVDHNMNGLTPAAYLARFIAEQIGTLPTVTGDDVYTARQAFLRINFEFRLHLWSRWAQVAREGKYGPSAAAAMVKLHKDGTYSYAQVADCFIVEVRKDGTCVLVTPDQLVGVDNGSMAEARQRLRDGVPPEEILADPKVRAILKENRLKNNVVFGVLNGEDDVKNLLCHGRRSLDGVAALVIMSDGMVPPTAGRESGAEMAARAMVDMGVSAYWRMLKSLYDADPDFRKYLRFKHMDDATGMVITLD
ncbi:MAG: hypothetical protein GC134_05275 [Proteobacteria bacterium]|nr:hypothetical protein [Pseudomonadota bacterium]